MIGKQHKMTVIAVTPFASTPGDEVQHGISITAEIAKCKAVDFHRIAGDFAKGYDLLFGGQIPVKASVEMKVPPMEDLTVSFVTPKLPRLPCELTRVEITPSSAKDDPYGSAKITLKIQRASESTMGKINMMLREEIALKLDRMNGELPLGTRKGARDE